MSVEKRIMHFRNERARELERMAKLLERHIGTSVNTSGIYKAISELKNENYIPVLKNGTRDVNIWGYDIEGFELSLETLKHVSPNEIKKGTVYLDVKLRAHIGNWEEMNDPFIELGFRVFIKGVGTRVYHFGFHIDKHNATSPSTEPHPIYHLQYDVNPTKSSTHDSGVVMYLDTPRLMHCPIDFILGVGFLTSNFSPIAFELLSEDNEFRNLNAKYQEKIWKPYFHTMANHWKPFVEKNLLWKDPVNLCPSII